MPAIAQASRVISIYLPIRFLVVRQNLCCNRLDFAFASARARRVPNAHRNRPVYAYEYESYYYYYDHTYYTIISILS